jgi:hypothetical protein
MYASTLLATLLGASAVVAAPAWPQIKWDVAAAVGGDNAISEYFNVLASMIEYAKGLPQAPVCDLSKAQIPTGEPPG